MAKGDDNKVQNQIDTQGGIAQNTINNLGQQNQAQTQQFQSLYGPAVQQAQNNYGDITNAYNSFLKGMPNSASLYSTFLGPKYAGASATGPASATLTSSGQQPQVSNDPVDQLFATQGVKDTGQGSGVTDASYWKDKINNAPDDATKQYYLGRLTDDLKGNGMDAFNPSTGTSGYGSTNSAINSAISGYQNFADTGGFSPQDISAIRARSVAPIRSMADTNNQEIQRQAALRGTGYSPNSIAAIAKIARDANYSAGDTATNAEANIAQLQQQGKLYGLGGLASTGLSDQANTTANRNLDLGAINAAGNQQLGAMSGLNSAYGTTPGLANMFGNQVLASGNQGIQLGGLQNQLASMIINGQLGKSQIPGGFQSALGNIGSGMGLLGSLGNLFGGMGGGGNNSFDTNSAFDSNGYFTGPSTFGGGYGGGEPTGGGGGYYDDGTGQYIG